MLQYRDPRFADCVHMLIISAAMSLLHSNLARHALGAYGRHGPDVSGVVRDHFPLHIKADLRYYARQVSYWSDRAMNARPKGVHRATINRLRQYVRDTHGAGFYG